MMFRPNLTEEAVSGFRKSTKNPKSKITTCHSIFRIVVVKKKQKNIEVIRQIDLRYSYYLSEESVGFLYGYGTS